MRKVSSQVLLTDTPDAARYKVPKESPLIEKKKKMSICGTFSLTLLEMLDQICSQSSQLQTTSSPPCQEATTLIDTYPLSSKI